MKYIISITIIFLIFILILLVKEKRSVRGSLTDKKKAHDVFSKFIVKWAKNEYQIEGVIDSSTPKFFDHNNFKENPNYFESYIHEKDNNDWVWEKLFLKNHLMSGFYYIFPKHGTR